MALMLTSNVLTLDLVDHLYFYKTFFVEIVFQVLTVLELKNFRFYRRLLNNFKRIN